MLTFLDARPGQILAHPNGDKFTVDRIDRDDPNLAQRIYLIPLGTRSGPVSPSYYAREFDLVGFTLEPPIPTRTPTHTPIHGKV